VHQVAQQNAADEAAQTGTSQQNEDRAQIGFLAKIHGETHEEGRSRSTERLTFRFLSDNCTRSIRRAQDHAGAHRIVGGLVDDDESTGATVVGIGVDRQGLGQLEGDLGDVVHL